MGLQPKQPRGRAGPGQGEAAFSCQGGALLRLSPSLRGPTTAGASMPARLEVEQPEATQVTELGTGMHLHPLPFPYWKVLRRCWSQPELRAFGWGWESGQGGHLQVAWASSRQKRARGPGRGSVAQDGTEPSAHGWASFLATGLTSPIPTQSPGSQLCPP